MDLHAAKAPLLLLISDIGDIDFGIRYISTKAASYSAAAERERAATRVCIFCAHSPPRRYWYSITGLRVGESPFFRSARQLLRQLSFIYLYDHLRVFSAAILSTLFRFTNFASNSILALCSPVHHPIVLFAGYITWQYCHHHEFNSSLFYLLILIQKICNVIHLYVYLINDFRTRKIYE